MSRSPAVAPALLIAVCALLAAPAPGAAEGAPPDDLSVDLVTVHPGRGIWARFGHTALRISSPSTGADRVYDFGRARFSERSFLWRYVVGEARFRAGEGDWHAFLERHRRADRTVERQRLALSPEESRAIDVEVRAFLGRDGGVYRYHQLEDNCTTRVRDLIDGASGGALRRASGGPTGRTYRFHTSRAMAGRPGLGFVLDFVGGPNQDRPLDGWMELYLPIPLRDAAARAIVERGESSEPLVVATQIHHRQAHPPPRLPPWTPRALVLGAAALVALAVLAARRWAGRWSRLAGGMLVAFGGFVGFWSVAAWGLVAVSEVPDFAWNENVLAWLPSDGWLAVWGARWLRDPPAQPSVALRRYAALRCGWAALLLLSRSVGILTQGNLAFLVAPALVMASFLPRVAPLRVQRLRAAASRGPVRGMRTPRLG